MCSAGPAVSENQSHQRANLLRHIFRYLATSSTGDCTVPYLSKSVSRLHGIFLIMLNFCLVLYYLSFPKDRWGSKAVVCFIYILETIQTIMITNDCFNKYAKQFGDTAALDSIQLEWLTVPVFTAIGELCYDVHPTSLIQRYPPVSCVVQLFYAYRLSILASDRRYIVICVCSVNTRTLLTIL